MTLIPKPRLEYPLTGASPMALVPEHRHGYVSPHLGASGIAQQPRHVFPGTGRSDCPSSRIPVDFCPFAVA